MFTKKENYSKLLQVQEIKPDTTFEDTITFWDVATFENSTDELEDSYITIEVWTDENNSIKIIESDDTDHEEISDKLPKNVLNHLHKLVYAELNKL